MPWLILRAIISYISTVAMCPAIKCTMI